MCSAIEVHHDPRPSLARVVVFLVDDMATMSRARCSPL